MSLCADDDDDHTDGDDADGCDDCLCAFVACVVCMIVWSSQPLSRPKLLVCPRPGVKESPSMAAMDGLEDVLQGCRSFLVEVI